MDDRRLALSTACEAAEAFCVGTGASVAPAGSITVSGQRYVFNDGQVGEITKEVLNALLDIQLERTPDRFNWLYDTFGQVW